MVRVDRSELAVFGVDAVDLSVQRVDCREDEGSSQRESVFEEFEGEEETQL